ncbi:MAG TPA: hypothetical protein VL947_02455 [Cytophagales bacterium]|nr:hypothetical protein [Cytophagales bacterium]
MFGLFLMRTMLCILFAVFSIACTDHGRHNFKESSGVSNTSSAPEILSPESVVVPDSLKVAEYFAWVNDPSSGHIMEKLERDQSYRVSYRPILFDALSHLKTTEITKSKVDSLIALKSGDLMFMVDVNPRITSTKQLARKSSGETTLGYEQYDPLLIAGTDTLHKTFIHLEYGLNDLKRYYVVYRRPQKWSKDDFSHASFVWNVSNRITSFYFLKKILDSSPKIKYHESL